MIQGKFKLRKGVFSKKQMHYGPNGEELLIEGNIYDCKDFSQDQLATWRHLRWIVFETDAGYNYVG
jgi:hypothetical protein